MFFEIKGGEDMLGSVRYRLGAVLAGLLYGLPSRGKTGLNSARHRLGVILFVLMYGVPSKIKANRKGLYKISFKLSMFLLAGVMWMALVGPMTFPVREGELS